MQWRVARRGQGVGCWLCVRRKPQAPRTAKIAIWGPWLSNGRQLCTSPQKGAPGAATGDAARALIRTASSGRFSVGSRNGAQPRRKGSSSEMTRSSIPRRPTSVCLHPQRLTRPEEACRSRASGCANLAREDRRSEQRPSPPHTPSVPGPYAVERPTGCDSVLRQFDRTEW